MGDRMKRARRKKIVAVPTRLHVALFGETLAQGFAEQEARGYTPCPCRDCFKVAIDGKLCHDCKAADCEASGEHECRVLP